MKIYGTSLYLGIILIGFLLVFNSQVQANTVEGITGLINTPTASVMPDGQLSANFHSFRGERFAAIGLGVFPGVEVGLSSHLASHTELVGSLKVNLITEDDWPAIAVGLQSSHDGTDYYIVGSKQLGTVGLRGHFGIGTGKFRGGFGGISSVLNPVAISNTSSNFVVPLTTFMIEYDGYGLNSGLSFKFGQDLAAKVYVTDLQNFGFSFKYSVMF